jgi:hypothetical protein
MRRHELTDHQWQRIASLFPKNGGKGGQWKEPPDHPQRHAVAAAQRRRLPRPARALWPLANRV